MPIPGNKVGSKKVKEFFIAPFGKDAVNTIYSEIGDYGGAALRDGQNDSLKMPGKVPDDFLSLLSVHAVIVPGATGNLYCGTTTDIATEGEDYNIHSSSKALAAYAATVSKILKIDITSALTLLERGDFFGVTFRRDASDPLDTSSANATFIGLVIKYVAKE